LLPPRDLKIVVLVNTKWRDLGEDPSLWKWCRVRVNKWVHIKHLSMRRFQWIQEILVWSPDQADLFNYVGNWNADDWEAVFQAVTRLPRIKKMDLRGNNLSSLEPGLFTRALTRLEDVNLSYCNFTVDQKEALFTALCNNSQLKKLGVGYSNLSSVEPRLFAKAITSLEDVDLGNTDITNVQAQELFIEICQNCSLKKLDLYRNNLSHVDPAVLATAVNRLEDVDLTRTMLSNEQIFSILGQVQEDTKLTTLWLRGNAKVGSEFFVSFLFRNAKKRLGDGLKMDLRLAM